jgi:hypothetical protein
MNIGSSPGAQAATQLMQANSQVVKQAAQQVQVANDNLTQVKTAALQQNAKQAAASAERKGNIINVMA